MISEIWRDIPFASDYQVSNLGRILSKQRIIYQRNGKPYTVSEKILKPQTFNYATVDLRIGKLVLVHRAVASAFLGLDYSDVLCLVNHKDGNRLNNQLTNLELCDHSYNIKDGFNRGRVIHNKGKSLLSLDDKLEIIKLCKSGIPQRQIAKLFNVSQSKISGVLNEHKCKNN